MARPNGVRELWQAGKPVIDSRVDVPSSFSAEVPNRENVINKEVLE